ncbi:MAG: hypothetical protein ACOC1K_07620, partial [Nanoarchaeota archaeon]
MKIKKSPDKEKAKSLFRMAETTLKRLNKMDKKQFPSNTLIDYYDIIHQLMEGLTSIEGVKIKGKGAHYELIKYICSKYGFSESTEDFLQQIRKFRNRISYEGFFINKDFIERNSSKFQKIINKL